MSFVLKLIIAIAVEFLSLRTQGQKDRTDESKLV
jgi:hypothetical protein